MSHPRPSLSEVGDLVQTDEIPASGNALARMTVLSIASLSLHHFRNYESARIEVSAAPVILTGPNGAGKTNILEAVSLLTPGRGLRRAKLGEISSMHSSPRRGEAGRGAQFVSSEQDCPPPNLPPRGGGAWAIAANIHGIQGETFIGTALDDEGDADKRLVKIDGKKAGQSQLAQHLAMLWLTPSMEQLFQESASSGRKFLDRLVYNFDPEHASRVNEYEYAMRERNKLLQAERWDANWLDALEQTMAETGCAIAASRLQTAATLNQVMAGSTLSFPKADVQMRGFCEELLLAGKSALEVEDDFRALLFASRKQDGAAGRALHGVHRSELIAIHLEKHRPAGQCSTGEQKAVLLSIILAQARATARFRGVVPVLLFDEVIAHLDGTRKLELFEEICQIGAQVFMTGTDAKLFAGLEQKAQLFLIENGNIHG